MWSVQGGSTNGTINQNGLYAAPDPVPNPASVTIVATSQADSTKSGPAPVSLSYPAPTLNSVSPNIIAAGSADTVVTLTGSSFSHASVASLSSAELATAFLSSTTLTATVPASLLKSAGNDLISVSNPAPGGGTSSAQSFAIMAVGAVTLFSVPATFGNTTGPWQLIAAVVDPQGNPIPDLFVTFEASSGTLSLSRGTTDAVGSLSATISPPANAGPGSATAVSAIVGNHVATVNISFAAFPSARSFRQPMQTSQQSQQAGSSSSFMQEPYEFGVSRQPSDPSSPLLSPDACYTPLDLTAADSTAACGPFYASNHVTKTLSNFVNESCQTISQFSDIGGLVNCVGTIAIVSVCLGTPGGEIVCAGNLSTFSGPALGCLSFIASKIAQHFQSQLAIQIVDAVGIVSGPDPLSVAGVICDALQATSSTGPRIYVTNSGDGTVTVFNESGQLLFSFSGLVTPDGIAYDAVKQQLYITDVGDNTIKVYTLDGQRVDVGTAFPTNPGGNPEDIIFDPVNRRFYVNDTTFNSVYVYSETGSLVNTLPPGAFSGLSQPFGIAFNHVTG
jgi:hypothetical protein